MKFIKEVREGRYGKVKDRQVRKFQNLINKNNSNNNNRAGRDSRTNNNGLEQAVNANNIDRSNNNSNNNNPMPHNSKGVINLSKTNLMEGQKSVLAKGPNFSLAPKYIPTVNYITAVESVCSKLKEDEVMELRSDVNALLRKATAPKPSLIKEERIELAHLKRHKDRVILTADKGVTMVVMDREEYISKAEELLLCRAVCVYEH